MVKIKKITAEVIIGAIAAFFLWIFGIIPMVISYIAEFTAEALGAFAVAIGSFGAWLRRRVDEPHEKATWGFIITIGIVLLFLAGFKVENIFPFLLTAPGLVSLFFVIIALWILIKYKDLKYAFAVFIIAFVTLFIYGTKLVITLELLVIMFIAVIGLLIKFKKKVVDIWEEKGGE
ncbi:MAG: hypothetical protein AB1485_06395 [Candidatus Thermoplasmatota archaeon]